MAAIDIEPIPSVSTRRLSRVRVSTPAASRAKCPPCKTEKSRRRTLRYPRASGFVTDAHRFSDEVDVTCPLLAVPCERPLPWIRPGPMMEKSLEAFAVEEEKHQ